MLTARYMHGTTQLDGKIYVVGGLGAAHNTLASVEEYDPATDTWRSLADLPAPRSSLGVVSTYYGKIYAIGGLDSAGYPTDSVYEYDPWTGVWSSRKSLPAPRADFAAASARYGNVYIFGGLAGSRDDTSVLIYDSWGDGWTTLEAPMPRPRARGAAVQGANDRVYLLGGDGYYGSSQGPIAEVDILDALGPVWLSAPPMPTPLALLGAASFNDKIYTLGGVGGDVSDALVQRYDPETNGWSMDTPMPTGRFGLGAVGMRDWITWESRLFAIGGYDGDTVLNTVEEGVLIGQQHPTPTTLPTVPPTPVITPVPTAVPGQERMAVAYQVNPAHDGSQQAAALPSELARKWAVPLGEGISYPLIAGGKVFVTVANPSGYGTSLYALDGETGSVVWGPVDLEGTSWSSGIAYDDGRVFALNFNGVVRAFEAATGQLLWQETMRLQHSFTSPPTASRGIVYVGGSGSGGTLFALDAATGRELWAQDVTYGDHSSPALSEDGVFVSYACVRAFKFDRWSGDQVWWNVTGCSGGGGRTAVYHGGKLYARDTVTSPAGYIFGEDSNAVIGRFDAGPAPAFAAGRGFFVHNGRLSAIDLESNSTLWSYGDGAVTSAPLVAGSVVFVGTRLGGFVGIDVASGNPIWSDTLPAGVAAPDEHNASEPLTGLNAGEGLLVVPAGGWLVAYGEPAS
jgi:outer membrane protein assembly factor BamB/N-acetylneuraminic acid mutarotase